MINQENKLQRFLGKKITLKDLVSLTLWMYSGLLVIGMIMSKLFDVEFIDEFMKWPFKDVVFWLLFSFKVVPDLISWLGSINRKKSNGIKTR
ncbi:MAG: hypothetical protein CEO22_133 [Candidatus Berkelbacteria bacterium Gr01-1014_85]|uniref:Uncharacterized protein n=1 Tax=Candidatus Berkelbacteria bacterium Gr01-1014_85 TaxID=2017150 RepID=A0A554JDE5_9BACT|nr:MAG: hypothetical protein CEO22_133 [Candidatus Berkelbacteria bacterium Gr01-1014_85]